MEAIGRGPIEFLLSWIQNPDVEGHRVLANRLPFLFLAGGSQLPIDPAADLAAEAALRLQDPDHVTPAGETPSIAWWWRAGGVGCLTRTSGEDITVARVETALVIDDRAESLADREPGADAWREWLRIANALNLREQPTVITTTTTESAGTVRGQAKHGTVRDNGVDLDGVGGATLSPSWQAVRDQTMSALERSLVEKLARHEAEAAAGVIPTPVVGYEAAGHTHRFRLAGRADSRLRRPRQPGRRRPARPRAGPLARAP